MNSHSLFRPFPYEAISPQMRVDSVVAERPTVLVIQPGGELECAMTRSWVAALHKRADLHIVAGLQYAEILDIFLNPMRFHPVPHNPIDLLRLRRSLKGREFDHVLCLGNTLSSRLIASVCPTRKRIQTQIGPPERPSQIDAVLAVLFGRLGIEVPERDNAMLLTQRTLVTADELLREVGFDSGQPVPMIAPHAKADAALAASWQSAQPLMGTQLPVVLLPAGHEIEFIGTLVGKAFFITPSSPEVRAALIRRASLLLSNHPLSIELARLMHIPVTELNGIKSA